MLGCESRCGLSVSRAAGRALGGGLPAFLDVVALSVHLKDVDAVSEAVRQGPGQRLSSEPKISVHSSKGRVQGRHVFVCPPYLDFVHSGCVGQRFYEAVNYGAREFSDVGLSRRYAENV